MCHLPWSEEAENTRSNKVLQSTENMPFTEVELVVTEKMDGANACLTSEKVYARSHSGEPHREEWDYLKKKHREELMHKIPDHLAVYGEYLYARHSIKYTELPDYFLVFAVLDMEEEKWLSWKETVMTAIDLGLETVPVIEQGFWEEINKDRSPSGESEFGDTREGYVVRPFRGFDYGKWSDFAAKCVRENHVTTSELHWRKGGETETNELVEDEEK